MSEGTEPSSSSLALLHHHHHHPQQQPLPQPPPPPPSTASPSVAGAIVRGYRKGNWTLHETLILITAKRLDDERRAGGSSSSAHCSPSPSASTPATAVPRSAEQRWKWVENYCWRNGCLRSQNQCNDKWDNLLRDYKKVRGYEARVAVAHAGELPSYWAMERHERKERNLPTNLAAEVFEALTDVLGRRAARRANAAATAVSTLPPPPPPLSPPRLPQPPVNPTAPPPLTEPAPAPPPLPPGHPFASVEMSSDSSESENDDGAGTAEPEAKRQRLGSSVVRSATVLARTLLACEEKREQRHRELVELQERRLRLEEERTEMRRQGFAGLISAVNSLSGAIHALVADYRNSNHR